MAETGSHDGAPPWSEMAVADLKLILKRARASRPSSQWRARTTTTYWRAAPLSAASSDRPARRMIGPYLLFSYVADAKLAEGVGFEPTREREPPGGFQDRCLKPLGHPSGY
jgi:hypothetical protein